MPLWSSDLGSYVECMHCGEAFHPSVLKMPGEMTPHDHAVFRTLMIGVMVSMMDVDGSSDVFEIEAIAAIYSELAGGPVSPQVLRQGIEMARKAGADGAVALASEFNPRLDPLSRELVFRSALYVSAADGALEQDEMDFLAEVGRSLGLDADHMSAILRSAQSMGHVSLGGSA